MAIRKTTKTNGITLSYLEQNEAAQLTLFFIHGNSGSAEMWRKQFDSPELSSYRLIAFDLPAHGASDALPPDKYNLPFFAAILSDAIRMLSNNKPFAVSGFSLGTNIVAEMLRYDVQPKGIVLIGACIIGNGRSFQDIMKEGADLTPMFTDDASKGAVEQCIRQACLSKSKEDLNQLYKDYKAVKPFFRPAILQSALEGKVGDEIGFLEAYDLPLLVIFGNEEQLIKQDYLDGSSLPLWHGKIHKIPGGSHCIHIDQPEQVNSLMRIYLREQLTGIPA